MCYWSREQEAFGQHTICLESAPWLDPDPGLIETLIQSWRSETDIPQEGNGEYNRSSGCREKVTSLKKVLVSF